MKRYYTTIKCFGLLFACLLYSSATLANQGQSPQTQITDSVTQTNQGQPPWVTEAQNLGLEVWNARPTAFKICPEPESSPTQDYAQCFTINNVAYCKCIQEIGSSISLPFIFSKNPPSAPGPIAGDVCDLMAVSNQGDFLISMFSPPPQLQKSYPGPDVLAIYTCANSGNLSAQCDAGLCFQGTAGSSWPYLGDINEDEIVCSCPIAASQQIGFQFIGPADCDRDFFEKYCGIQSSNGGTNVTTGTQLAVGAVTGSGTILTKLLTGNVPPANRCFFPALQTTVAD